MRPLIEIQTIPIEIQMKTTNAHLEYARGTAQMEVSRDRRGLQIRSQPIRVNIDTFEARSSIVPISAPQQAPDNHLYTQASEYKQNQQSHALSVTP